MPYQGFARQKYGAADAPASAPEADEPEAEETKPAADAGAYPKLDMKVDLAIKSDAKLFLDA